MYRTVAVFVGVAAPDQADVDGNGLIQKTLLPLDVHQLHQVLFGTFVQLSAAVSGVGKGVEAHMGDGSNVVGRNVPEHMGDDALGQVISLNFVGQGQVPQPGRPVPVAAHHPLAHTLAAEVVAAGAVPVALARGEEQRQVPGMPGFLEALFQGLGQRLGTGAADKSAGGDGIAVLDHQRRFFCSDDANFFHAFRTPFFLIK